MIFALRESVSISVLNTSLPSLYNTPHDGTASTSTVAICPCVFLWRCLCHGPSHSWCLSLPTDYSVPLSPNMRATPFPGLRIRSLFTLDASMTHYQLLSMALYRSSVRLLLAPISTCFSSLRSPSIAGQNGRLFKCVCSTLLNAASLSCRRSPKARVAFHSCLPCVDGSPLDGDLHYFWFL